VVGLNDTQVVVENLDELGYVQKEFATSLGGDCERIWVHCHAITFRKEKELTLKIMLKRYL
jgi:hypothetical protein